MRFLTPSNLPWAALIAVPVLLYLFRLKPKTVQVSSLNFFKTLARAHRESPWLRRLKHLLSFLLSVFVVLGLTAALMRPVVSPPAGSLKSVVLLVDRSASMGARAGGSGPTLLQTGLERARDRLDGLPRGVGVLVIAYDRRPEIVLPRTIDRRSLSRALDRIRSRPIEGRPRRALRLARRLAGVEPPAAVWHVTDSPSVEEDSPELEAADSPEEPPVRVEKLPVALEASVNAGITAFELRRLPLEHNRLEAFVALRCAGSEPVEVELEVRIDGRLRDIRELTLRPGTPEQLLIPLEAEAGRILGLRLSCPGDALAADNRLHARIPRLRPVRVLWISAEPRPFTELALTTLGRSDEIEIYRATPEDWPPQDPADLVVFHGWLPGAGAEEEANPGGDASAGSIPPAFSDAALVVIDPPRTAGRPDLPFRSVPFDSGGLPVERVRSTDRRHPLLYGVAEGRIALRQTAALESAGSLEPLWIGPSGPVMLAGESRGRRMVVMGFEPEASGSLPLTFSFPILMGNVVYWSTAPPESAGAGGVHRTGRVVELEGNSIEWAVPGPTKTRKTRIQLPDARTEGEPRQIELDRIGLYRTDAGEEGSAVLLSSSETELGAASVKASGEAGAQAGPSLLGLSGELTTFLLWGILFALVVESWLMHRYSVY